MNRPLFAIIVAGSALVACGGQPSGGGQLAGKGDFDGEVSSLANIGQQITVATCEVTERSVSCWPNKANFIGTAFSPFGREPAPAFSRAHNLSMELLSSPVTSLGRQCWDTGEHPCDMVDGLGPATWSVPAGHTLPMTLLVRGRFDAGLAPARGEDSPPRHFLDFAVHKFLSRPATIEIVVPLHRWEVGFVRARAERPAYMQRYKYQLDNCFVDPELVDRYCGTDSTTTLSFDLAPGTLDAPAIKVLPVAGSKPIELVYPPSNQHMGTIAGPGLHTVELSGIVSALELPATW